MLNFIRNYLIIFSFFILPDCVFAKPGISGIANHLSKQLDTIAVLLVVVAYVAGVGFSLMGITQFKAHKDQPQQVPLSKPIVYLAIASALLFLPTVMKTAGESVFGGTSDSKKTGSMDFRAIDLE